MEGWEQQGDSGKRSPRVRVSWEGRLGFPILSSNWWGYWSLEQPCSNTGASFHEPGDSQTQVSVTAKYFYCPLTNTAGPFSLLQRCGISLLIRGSHILWWHQSTSQQISYCRVGKSFCWSSHLWLLSLWVAPVYLNSDWEAAKTHSISNRLGAL